MKKNLIMVIIFFSVCRIFCVSVGAYFVLEDDTSFISSHDVENNKFKFDMWKNKDKADVNLLVKTSDIFTFQPFFKIYDLIWSIDRDGKGKFSEINIMPGIGFNFKYKNKITFFTWIANLDRFVELSGFWLGLNIGMQVNANLEKQYLTLMFKNDLMPLFLYEYNTTHKFELYDIFCYLITFNCFNYYNKKSNSGIYIQGKLEVETKFFNSDYLSTRFSHYLYTGFIFNPHKIFNCYIAYAMFNTQIINSDPNLVTNIWNIGLRTGFNFFVKWFTIQFYYLPFIFNYSNDFTNKMTHTIGAVITFTLK